MIRVAVAGALGRMGRLVIDEIGKSQEMQLVAGFDIAGAGTAIGGISVSDAADIRRVLEETKPDVLIDFTIARAAVGNVLAAAGTGTNLVVGTTGISPDQMEEMRRAIADGKVAAVISPNFSIGVNLFWRLIGIAAQALKDYDVEVIEAHHNQKKDAPSGTALAAVDVLKKALSTDDVVFGREGMGLRGKEIGVHAVRAGDIVGDHTVLFAGPGERLEIKHQAHSRAAFASGAARAARWVAGAQPGIYAMADVLNEQA